MVAGYESHEGARLGEIEAAEYLSVIFPAYSVNYICCRPVLCTTISSFIICPLVSSSMLTPSGGLLYHNTVCVHNYCTYAVLSLLCVKTPECDIFVSGAA